MKYLSIQQFKNFDTGIAINDLSDLSLSQYITLAETDIDAFQGFEPRLGGFDPGTLTYQALWDNETHRVDNPGSPVPIRKILRFNIQMSNISTTGAGFNAIINPNDIAINNFDSYVEIVPLTAITFSMFPTIIGMGLNPAIVLLDVTTGYYLESNNEILVDSGDHKTYYAQRGFWATTYDQAPSTIPLTPPTVPAVILVDGNNPVISYSQNTIDGSVTFASALQATNVVTGNYCYQIPDFVRDAAKLQVLYYVRQRAMMKQGIYPELKRIQSGDQHIMMQDLDKLQQGVNGSLCQAAAAKLQGVFQTIPIG